MNQETSMIILTVLGTWFGFVSYRAGIRKGFKNCIRDFVMYIDEIPSYEELGKQVTNFVFDYIEEEDKKLK